VAAMRWMTPHVLAVLSTREELVLLDAVALQPIDTVPLRDLQLVYQPHFANLAAAATVRQVGPALTAGSKAVVAGAPATSTERFVNIFTQSLNVQRQAVFLMVPRPCHWHCDGRLSLLTMLALQPCSGTSQGLREVAVVYLTTWTSRIEALVRQNDYAHAIQAVRGHIKMWLKDSTSSP